jgi:hypothetical protein
VFPRPIEIVELLGDCESVTDTTATTPLAIVLTFIPVATQTDVPLVVRQSRVLPAVVSAVPGETLTEAISEGA